MSWKQFVITTFGAATNSHAKYYNSKYNRDGKLFVRPTLHGLTDKGEPGKLYSRTLAAYIAYNYYKHGLAPAESAYMWSSHTAPKYHIIEPDIELHYGNEEAFKAFNIWYLKKYGARMLAFDEEKFFALLTPRKYYEDYNEWRAVEGGEGLDAGS